MQRFHTANVKRRIQKYMPYRTGATIKLMIAQSPVNEPFLHVNVPYARMLYYGKVMVDPETGMPVRPACQLSDAQRLAVPAGGGQGGQQPGHPVRQDQEPQSRALLGPPPDRR